MSGKIDRIKRRVREYTEDDFYREFGNLRTKHYLAIEHNEDYTDYLLIHKPLTIRVKKGEDNG